MYRIRLHGRGGQGMKTASRILGSALFLEGYEVQDAPRYGAERRGAPIFAYVRADKQPINERGIIASPDLIIVADDSLVPVAAAGVLAGVDADCVLLINSDDDKETWRQRLNFKGKIYTLPVETEDRAELRFIGATCSGAAACLLGIISRESLTQAIQTELSALGMAVINTNLTKALAAFDHMQTAAGCVSEGKAILATDYQSPDWVQLPFEEARTSAPAIHAAATSVNVNTGVWRTLRPVIDYQLCNKCWWICSTFCPDGAIDVDDNNTPQIDYQHCKGCMICVAQCPPHAISSVAEELAQANEKKAAKRKQGVRS
ncbi:MAG: 2-oxoacid:acceptor oxidoreductase family protein [Gammaproteobacteria bacterium]|nr:2-oxoacid:acceptor oxidoreductase family protein [Gammaproteobacteria bacterium]